MRTSKNIIKLNLNFFKLFKLLLALGLVFLLYGTLKEKAYALTCVSTLTYQPSLVIATVDTQDVDFDSLVIKNNFRTLLTVKGNAPKSFTIVTPSVYPRTVGNLVIPVCEGCPEPPS